MESVYEKGDHLNVSMTVGKQEFKNEAELKKYIAKQEKEMRKAAGNLDFEIAAKLRDEIHELEKGLLG